MALRLCGTIALVIAGMIGCNSEPGFDRYLSTAPAHDEVVGTWQALERSLLDFKRNTRFAIAHPGAHEIVLDRSGTCSFKTHWQYSYVDRDDPEDATYFDTANCDWRLGGATTRVKTEYFDAPAVWLRIRQGERAASAYYFIARRNERLVLWQSIGEPDSGYYMEFVQSAK